MENCQIGVFLTYATKHDRTFLDRELYLPKEWTDDPDRCAAADVPEDRGFKTKPALAIDMIKRALGAGVPAKWGARRRDGRGPGPVRVADPFRR